MDFTYTEEQRAISDLAGEILGDLASDERVVASEQGPERFDRQLWQALADAGLLGVALPEEAGGGGLGVVGLALLLEQQGRHVAHVPLWATLALGALPLARFGTGDQRDRLLPGVLAGDVVLTGVLDDPTPFRVSPEGEGWALHGTAAVVPQAPYADAMLIPARHDDGTTSVFVVPTVSTGVTITPVETVSRAMHGRLELDETSVGRADLLGAGGAGGQVVTWARQRADVGIAALQTGVGAEAVRRTAAYVSQREQFGKPLSTNQGVAMRAADAYIDTESIRVTMLEAAWRLDEGLDASAQCLATRWWASEAGHRVVHATQHLHGGMGADVDNPIHRFFFWGRELDLLSGSAQRSLTQLGQLIAERAA